MAVRLDLVNFQVLGVELQDASLGMIDAEDGVADRHDDLSLVLWSVAGYAGIMHARGGRMLIRIKPMARSPA
jgi:aminoglycoside phosphotransferase